MAASFSGSVHLSAAASSSRDSRLARVAAASRASESCFTAGSSERIAEVAAWKTA